jgi:putrescine transport system permease protein
MHRSKAIWIFTALAFGYAFLYIPIFLLILYSFNDSKLVSVWGGWSLRWYGSLWQNEQVLNGIWLSLRVAAFSASLAVGIGTLAGFALARFGLFRGRTLLAGMISAPLVMPEVITGLSLLMLFVLLGQTLGWPERGMTTLIIAHVTFTAAYVAVIVQSRLVSMDLSIEEAAMDLGARPAKVFFVITLPIIAPALISGWLLAFTLSLDDLVTSQFVAGPGSTTLPMIVFSKVRLGVSPEINALASLIVLVVALAVFGGGYYLVRAERRRQLEERMAYAGNQPR